MAIALFLLALGLFNVSAMEVLNAPIAYCGGAGGGGDDPDDWGDKWPGQIAFSTLRTNTKNKGTTKNNW